MFRPQERIHRVYIVEKPHIHLVRRRPRAHAIYKREDARSHRNLYVDGWRSTRVVDKPTKSVNGHAMNKYLACSGRIENCSSQF